MWNSSSVAVTVLPVEPPGAELAADADVAGGAAAGTDDDELPPELPHPVRSTPPPITAISGLAQREPWRYLRELMASFRGAPDISRPVRFLSARRPSAPGSPEPFVLDDRASGHGRC